MSDCAGCKKLSEEREQMVSELRIIKEQVCTLKMMLELAKARGEMWEAQYQIEMMRSDEDVSNLMREMN